MFRAPQNYYEDPSALGNRLRRKRFAHVEKLVVGITSEKGRCRVLDLGGTETYWRPHHRFLDERNVHVTLLNLSMAETSHARCTAAVGNATKTGFSDDEFDLVHSNSVIEHVGRWSDMKAMAFEVRRLAPAYFVQVPNFWFPIEPHFRAPFFHWMPETIRARILMRVGLGFAARAKDLSAAMERVQSAQLLDASQMRALFPDGRLTRERFLGITKSLMAIRSSRKSDV